MKEINPILARSVKKGVGLLVTVVVLGCTLPLSAGAAPVNYFTGNLGGNGYTNSGAFRQIAYMQISANHNSYCMYRATANYVGAPSASGTEYCSSSGGTAYQSFHCYTGYPASHNRHSFNISVSGTIYDSCISSRAAPEQLTAGSELDLAIDRTADSFELSRSSVRPSNAADGTETFSVSGPKLQCVAAVLNEGLGMGCGEDDAHAMLVERSTTSNSDRVIGLVPPGVVGVRGIGPAAMKQTSVVGRRSFSIVGAELTAVELETDAGATTTIELR